MSIRSYREQTVRQLPRFIDCLIYQSDDPGCFRCHDDVHATADKKTIPQDCGTCHQMLASEEAAPAILKTLGLDAAISSVQKQ